MNESEKQTPSGTAATSASATKDPSKTVAAVWIPIIVAVSVAIGGGIGWIYDKKVQAAHEVAEIQQKVQTENQRLITEYLSKIQLKLEETKSLSEQLNRDYLVPSWGILESYVLKARENGHDKHVLMYGLISTLVQKDSELVTLLEGYEPYALSNEFKMQAAEFREHARTYVIRFEAIPKTVVTGQQLPPWKVFPVGFPGALQKEIAARKALSSS
ncbi:hypothetical protein [Pseudomonas sp. PSB11]|uniref:hypothetical protein n=1 Tax=Pseudomonas sp. PSB11 TaxID=2021969 RepID=UPI001660119C|nr:hypothetical protein [Pseudomonas sp. PSB11]MBD0678665.1 hypothetical protein [Pseudomonas sp. PSB11]